MRLPQSLPGGWNTCRGNWKTAVLSFHEPDSWEQRWQAWHYPGRRGLGRSETETGEAWGWKHLNGIYNDNNVVKSMCHLLPLSSRKIPIGLSPSSATATYILVLHRKICNKWQFLDLFESSSPDWPWRRLRTLLNLNLNSAISRYYKQSAF